MINIKILKNNFPFIYRYIDRAVIQFGWNRLVWQMSNSLEKISIRNKNIIRCIKGKNDFYIPYTLRFLIPLLETFDYKVRDVGFSINRIEIYKGKLNIDYYGNEYKNLKALLFSYIKESEYICSYCGKEEKPSVIHDDESICSICIKERKRDKKIAYFDHTVCKKCNSELCGGTEYEQSDNCELYKEFIKDLK